MKVKLNRWRFTATWGEKQFTGIELFESEPSSRDTDWVCLDISTMLQYMPSGLVVEWRPVED
jgi:hypothetical protein